jgi:iron complex outermembrane receptor protein
MNAMTKKKLIVFKLDTFILCTSIAPLNYIDKCRDDVFQAVMLINYQVGEKFMKRVSIFDGLEIRGITASFFATAVVFACLPQSALAQESAIEEITVTGSNIRRARDFETPSPIETIGMEEISDAGVGQMQDLLKVLPANAGSDLAGVREAQGVSQFSLRGLGVGGTLTLINGRRAGLSPISTGQGFFYTDINQYPTNMIQSVEVLKDGASATYGSDAVGGVVNIITRSSFEGMEIGGEYRENENNPAYSLNAAFGHAFDNGHFSIFANYYSQEGGARGEYDWLVERSQGRSFVPADNQYDSSTGAGRYDAAVDPDGDGFYDRVGNTVADANCGDPGALSGFVNTFLDGTNCRYIFLDQRALIGDETRLQTFAQFDYNLSDDTRVFAEASFSSNEVVDIIGGAPLDIRYDDGGHFVPADHPFNYFTLDGGGVPGVDNLVWDPAVVALDPLRAVDVIFRGRPLTNFDGDLAEDIEKNFENTRLAFGFDTNLSDKWSLYASAMFAHSIMTDVLPRNWNTFKFRETVASGRWNPFGIGWADPDAVSVKDGETTAGNTIYGPYTDTDLGQFAAYRTFVRESDQVVVDATVSGDMFNIGGNTGGAAFGVQYRKTDYSEIADSAQTFLQGGFEDLVFSINGASQDVLAVFGEVMIPVSDTFELQVALRYEDYGDGEGGDTTEPKVGFRWQASDSIQLRGTYGTSFQAPSVRNIAGAGGGGSLADAITQTVFDAGPGSVCDSDVFDNFNVTTTTLGGDLDPQTATNYNLGVVFTTESFTGSVDYWNYDYEDLIGPGESAASILTNECSNSIYVPDARVTRDSNGQVISVVNSFTNLGGVEADGIDLSATYIFDDVAGGQLGLNAYLTYITNYDVDQGDGSPTFDGLNNRNASFGQLGSVPETRLNVGVDWRTDKHAVNLWARYIGGYDDRSPGNEFEAIDSWTVLDFQYMLSLNVGGGVTDLSIGVNNLTDEDPPAIDRASANGRRAFDNQVHDPRGQIFYLRFKHSF